MALSLDLLAYRVNPDTNKVELVFARADGCVSYMAVSGGASAEFIDSGALDKNLSNSPFQSPERLIRTAVRIDNDSARWTAFQVAINEPETCSDYT
jgi:hypothetical protein